MELAKNHRKEANPPHGLLRQLRLNGPFATARARALLAVWAILTAGAVAILVATDVHKANARLQELGVGYLQHISDRALVSETAIEGFAAFVASMERFNHDRATHYAGELLARYPFLYMFEVAVRVAHEERAAAEAALAARQPGAAFKRFTYATDRTWQPVEPAEFYYPLIFQQPLLQGAGNLIGLNIVSTDMLSVAMQASFERGEPVATHPFELAEGGRGYILHRSVEHVGGRPPSAFQAGAYVLLALQARQLFSDLLDGPPGIAIRVSHHDFADDDARGEILSIAAAPVSAAEKALLPCFHFERALELDSQPLVLRLDWQFGWGDLSLGALAGILSGSLVLFLAVRSYARYYIDSGLEALESGGRLYELANFDALTGLANRNRLIDFLEGELARARRHRQWLVVLFIDVNGFKQVNDTHGHATGDLVLIEVARRLSLELREDELLARYGGDEFIWVTAPTDEKPPLDQLIRRLKGRFADPIRVKSNAFALSVSIGCALYPQSGKNVAALFEAADDDMYRDKQGSRREA